MKKAQSLSINTLIIATLGLVVLIILGTVFFNKTKSFSDGLEKCSAKLGSCDSENLCASSSGQVIRNTDCEKTSKVCCIKLGTETKTTPVSSTNTSSPYSINSRDRR